MIKKLPSLFFGLFFITNLVIAQDFEKNFGVSKFASHIAPWQTFAYVLVNIGLLFWAFAVIKKLIDSKGDDGMREVIGWVIAAMASNLLISVLPQIINPILK